MRGRHGLQSLYTCGHSAAVFTARVSDCKAGTDFVTFHGGIVCVPGCRAEDRRNGIKPAPFGGVARGKNAVRPPAAPFNPEEARSADQMVETRHHADNVYVMNNRTFANGYERKRFSLKVVEPLKDPPLTEARMFANAGAVDAETCQRVHCFCMQNLRSTCMACSSP